MSSSPGMERTHVKFTCCQLHVYITRGRCTHAYSYEQKHILVIFKESEEYDQLRLALNDIRLKVEQLDNVTVDGAQPDGRYARKCSQENCLLLSYSNNNMQYYIITRKHAYRIALIFRGSKFSRIASSFFSLK